MRQVPPAPKKLAGKPDQQLMSNPPHIFILGSGFAALSAAKELRRRSSTAQISLVAPKAEFIYYPSLICLPAGLHSGEDLRLNLNAWLTKNRIRFREASVTGLADGERTVLTDQGEFVNDGLIIASGGRFLKALPGIEHALTICEGIPATEKIRDRLAAMQGGTIAFGFGTNSNRAGAKKSVSCSSTRQKSQASAWARKR